MLNPALITCDILAGHQDDPVPRSPISFGNRGSSLSRQLGLKALPPPGASALSSPDNYLEVPLPFSQVLFLSQGQRSWSACHQFGKAVLLKHTLYVIGRDLRSTCNIRASYPTFPISDARQLPEGRQCEGGTAQWPPEGNRTL